MTKVINVGLNMDIDTSMSNFDTQNARQQGVSFDVFQEKCGWTSDEVKERIIAARNGEEWLRGEGPDATKEAKERKLRRFESIKDEYSKERIRLLEISHDITVDTYYDYLDEEYQEWYGTQKDKHGIAISYFKNVMNDLHISYNNTDKSGIDFMLSNGDECVIHGLGTDADGFVIHDTIDKLKGDIFIYINNMSRRKHIVSIMSRHTILTNCRDRGTDPQTMIPRETMIANIDNYGIIR